MDYNKYIKYKKKYLELKGGIYIKEKLKESLFKNFRWILPIEKKFIEFILNKSYNNINDFYKNEEIIIDKELLQNIRNIISKFNETYKKIGTKWINYKNYSIGKYIHINKIEKIPINDTLFINLENVNTLTDEPYLYENINEIKYCNLLDEKMKEYIEKTRRNDTFILKMKKSCFGAEKSKNVYLNLEDLIEKFDYIGFNYYIFSKIIYHFYFYFRNKETNEIIITSNNGALVCYGNLYEAIKISYIIQNDLYYFNDNERQLNVYEYEDNIYFSLYTKYELLEKKDEELNKFVDEAIEMSLYEIEGIIYVIPYISEKNSDSYLGRRIQELESKFSEKRWGDVRPEIFNEILKIKSYKSGGNYCIYITDLNDDIKKKMDENISILEKYNNIKDVDDYIRVSKKQIHELTDEGMEEMIKQSEEKFLECRKLNEEEKKYVLENYSFKVNDEKPIFLSHKDLIKNINLNPDKIPEYVPEIKEILDKKIINEKIILDILSKRQLLLGKQKDIMKYNDYNLFYIISSFFFNNEQNILEHVPKIWNWTPERNKLYVQLLGKRDLIFPIRYIISKENLENYYDKNEKYKFIGIIQIKLRLQKDLTYFMFLKDNELFLFDFRTKRVFLDQGLNVFKRWFYIELNIIKYYFLEKLGYKLYQIEDKNEFLMSKYTLEEIEKKISDDEFRKLRQVNLDRNMNLVQIGGGKEKIDSIINSFKIYELKVGKKQYNKNINKFVNFKKFYDEYKTLSDSSIELGNKYDFLKHSFTYLHKGKTLFKNFYVRLKKKFIYDDLHIPFFMIFIILNLSKYDKILAISENYRIIEPIFYYLKNPDVHHLHYDRPIRPDIFNVTKNKTLIKENYKFDDEKFLIENIKEKFDLIIGDIMYTTKQNNESYEKCYEQILINETENLFLLEKIYKLLDNLNESGQLIIYLYSMITNKTLKIIQDITECFDLTFIMDFNTWFGYDMSCTYKMIIF